MGTGQKNGKVSELPHVQPPAWTPDAIDRDLLTSAAQKRREGKQLNRAESAVVRKAAAIKEEEQRWRIYQTIPQKHWARMSGRQWKVLTEQAELYGISFADPVIDLTKVVRQIHDFFAKHFRRFATPVEGEDGLLEGASKNLKDQWLKEKIRIEKMKADEMEKKAVYWDTLQPALVDFGTGMRKAGDILQRQFGPDAARILDEALDEFDRKLDQLTGGSDGVHRGGAESAEETAEGK